jgi:hypothetical protein
MVDEVSFALRPRLLGNRWGSYCWLRSRLDGRSWALGGWSQFRLPAEPFPFLMWAKHRPPPTVTVSQIGPLLAIIAADYVPFSQMSLGIGTAMEQFPIPATVRVFCPSANGAWFFARRIGELGL